MSFVSIRDEFQIYVGRPILKRVNLEVAEGEFISIVGASGCGKSTFLRMLLAQETPTRGSITVDGNTAAVEPGLERGGGRVACAAAYVVWAVSGPIRVRYWTGRASSSARPIGVERKVAPPVGRRRDRWTARHQPARFSEASDNEAWRQPSPRRTAATKSNSSEI